MFGFGRPRSQPGSDPFGSPYGGYGGFGGYGATPRQELEMRRRQQAQLALRRRQEQEALAARRQEALRQAQQQKQAQLQQQEARRRTFQRYQDAAIVIQRAFRAHRARQEEERRNKAALVLTTAVRRAAACSQARRVAASLRHLLQTRRDTREIRQAFEAHPTGYRNTQYVVDRLEKLIFALDAVPTHRSPFVRTVRKAVVGEAQAGLRFADVVFATMRRAATAIQRAVRAHQARKRMSMEITPASPPAAPSPPPEAMDAEMTHSETEMEGSAGAVAAAVMKGTDVMSLLRSKRRRLTQLREEYTRQLEDIVQELDALVASGKKAKKLKRTAGREARATLAALEAAAGGKTVRHELV